MSDIAKVFTTYMYQTFLYFCRNLNMFIKKKLKYFTRPKQISPDLSGDFRIVCIVWQRSLSTKYYAVFVEYKKSLYITMITIYEMLYH